MLEIRVLYHGALKETMKRKEEEVTTSAVTFTMKDLIVMLTEKHGEKFKKIVMSHNGRASPYTLIFLNDELIDFHGKGLETELHSGDTIEFTPAVGGG